MRKEWKYWIPLSGALLLFWDGLTVKEGLDEWFRKHSKKYVFFCAFYQAISCGCTANLIGNLVT